MTPPPTPKRLADRRYIIIPDRFLQEEVTTQHQAETAQQGPATQDSTNTGTAPPYRSKVSPASSYTRDKSDDMEDYTDYLQEAIKLALRGETASNQPEDLFQEIKDLERAAVRIGLNSQQRKLVTQPLYLQYFHQSLLRYKQSVLKANADPEQAIKIDDFVTNFSVLGKSKYLLIVIGLAAGLSRRDIKDAVLELQEDTKNDYKKLVLLDSLNGIKDYYEIPLNALDKDWQYFFKPRKILDDCLSPFEQGITHFRLGFF